MIIPTFLTLALQKRVLAINPDEVERARAFLRLALTDRRGRVEPRYLTSHDPEVDDSNLKTRGVREYHFRNGDVGVYLESGRLEFLSTSLPLADYAPAEVPRALTDEEATAVAERLWATSGWPGGIKVLDITDLMRSNGTSVEMHYCPTWRGIPLEGFQDRIALDRQTGRVDVFYAPNWLPSPPSDATVGGTPDQARLAALHAASAWRKTGLRESPRNPMHLVLWYVRPDTPNGERTEYGSVLATALGAGHRAEFRAGRAILAYAGTMLDEDLRPYGVTLDARTGAVLDMQDNNRATGRGGLAPRPVAVPTTVPIAAQPWRVSTGGKGWKAWTVSAPSALVPITHLVPERGARLALTDGRAAFPALYDPATGLLAISGRAYRPGPALAALLKRRAKA